MGDRRATRLRFGAIVTGTGAVLDDATVTVVGGKIVDLTHGATGGPVDVHRRDQTLIPGFVDAHVHLVFGYEPTHAEVRRAAESAPLGELVDRAAIHAMECLRGGVTTVRDCGDRHFVTVGLRNSIRAGERPGPHLAVAGPPLTVENGHLHWCGGVVDGPAQLGPAVDRLRERGVDLVKLMASGGTMTAESDPAQPQFSQAQIAEIIRHAHDAGLPVAAHAHSVETISSCTSAGVDSIEHCSWRSATGKVAMVDDVVTEIIDRNIAVVLTMAGIQRALLDGSAADEHGRAAALDSSETSTLRGDFAWARVMLDRGARMAIASDAGVRMTPFAGFADSVRCGIEALGIPATRAIAMATLVPATVIGMEGEVGSIEVGKTADLVALDGIVSDVSSWLPPVETVWQAGRQLTS